MVPSRHILPRVPEEEPSMYALNTDPEQACARRNNYPGIQVLSCYLLLSPLHAEESKFGLNRAQWILNRSRHIFLNTILLQLPSLNISKYLLNR